MKDLFNSRDVLKVGKKEYVIYRLAALAKAGLTDLKRLPFSIRVVLEAALRQCNDKEITQDDVKNIAAWTPLGARSWHSIFACTCRHAGFHRSPCGSGPGCHRAVARLGGDANKINPLVPVDLVIDHSVQIDFFATADALNR